MNERRFADRVEIRHREPSPDDHPERGPYSVWVEVDGGYPSAREAWKQAGSTWVAELERAGGDGYRVGEPARGGGGRRFE